MHLRPATFEIEPVEAWDRDDTTVAHEVTAEHRLELFRLAHVADDITARVERDVAWWLAERGHPALALEILSGAWRAA